MASLLKFTIYFQVLMLFSSHMQASPVPLTGEDLLKDSLMPVNITKIYKSHTRRQADSSEGSGHESIPIASLPVHLGMQRLTQDDAIENENKKETLSEVQNEAQDDGKSREEVEDPDDEVQSLHDIDEGSGASENEKEEEIEVPKTAAIVVSDIDDPFKKEDGMDKVLEDLAGPVSKQLETDDNNKHDNSLSVLGGEDDLPGELHETAEVVERENEEGSGASDLSSAAVPILEDNHDIENEAEEENKNTGSSSENVRVAEEHTPAEKDSEGDTVLTAGASGEVKESQLESTEAENLASEIADPNHEHSENNTEDKVDFKGSVDVPSLVNIDDNNGGEEKDIPTTPATEFEEEKGDDGENTSSQVQVDIETKESERLGKMIVDPDSDEQNIASTTVAPVDVIGERVNDDLASEVTPLPVDTDVTTEESVKTADVDIVDVLAVETTTEEEEGMPEEAAVTTTEEPGIAESPDTVEEVSETTTEQVEEVPDLIELPSTVEFVSSTEVVSSSTTEIPTDPILTDIEIKTTQETEVTADPSTEIPASVTTEESTEESTTFAVVLQGVMLAENTIGQREKITNSEEGLQSAGSVEDKSLGAYILIALIAIGFLTMVAFLVLRKRSKTQKARLDNNQERDPEKALLSNGKYKEETDENNVKNNEITPLVIKQNSQINKFEKNPNFSSPKNINTAVNDKNIEKDNVLKSTQAIIEEDDDAKKALEEAEEETDTVEEEKKALMGENSPTEKVIVRTHVDQDSIPKKPLLVTRNGNGYHAVSQDPA